MLKILEITDEQGASALPDSIHFGGGGFAVGERAADSKPEKRTMDKLLEAAWSSGRDRGGHEGGEEGTFGGADPAGIAAGGGRHQGGRHLPRARDQLGDVLHLEEEVFGTGFERTT